MNEIISSASETIDTAERVALYNDFQRLASEDLPIINLVEFTFITVARDDVQNIANNPRWATSSWADTWISD